MLIRFWSNNSASIWFFGSADECVSRECGFCVCVYLVQKHYSVRHRVQLIDLYSVIRTPTHRRSHTFVVVAMNVTYEWIIRQPTRRRHDNTKTRISHTWKSIKRCMQPKIRAFYGKHDRIIQSIYLILCAQLNNRFAKIQFRISVPHWRLLNTHFVTPIQIFRSQHGREEKNRYAIVWGLKWFYRVLVYRVVVRVWNDTGGKKETDCPHLRTRLSHYVSFIFAYGSFDNTTQNEFPDTWMRKCQIRYEKTSKVNSAQTHLTHHNELIHFTTLQCKRPHISQDTHLRSNKLSAVSAHHRHDTKLVLMSGVFSPFGAFRRAAKISFNRHGEKRLTVFRVSSWTRTVCSNDDFTNNIFAKKEEFRQLTPFSLLKIHNHCSDWAEQHVMKFLTLQMPPMLNRLWTDRLTTDRTAANRKKKVWKTATHYNRRVSHRSIVQNT